MAAALIAGLHQHEEGGFSNPSREDNAAQTLAMAKLKSSRVECMPDKSNVVYSGQSYFWRCVCVCVCVCVYVLNVLSVFVCDAGDLLKVPYAVRGERNLKGTISAEVTTDLRCVRVLCACACVCVCVCVFTVYSFTEQLKTSNNISLVRTALLLFFLPHIRCQTHALNTTTPKKHACTNAQIYTQEFQKIQARHWQAVFLLRDT
jgi:hypothetical protein